MQTTVSYNSSRKPPARPANCNRGTGERRRSYERREMPILPRQSQPRNTRRPQTVGSRARRASDRGRPLLHERRGSTSLRPLLAPEIRRRVRRSSVAQQQHMRPPGGPPPAWSDSRVGPARLASVAYGRMADVFGVGLDGALFLFLFFSSFSFSFSLYLAF